VNLKRVRIRHYQADDAELLAALFCRSVMELGGKDYSPVQIQAWAARGPTAAQFHARSTDGRLVLVVVGQEGARLAFAELEDDGHIDFFYCAPEAAGKGIASALYDRLEKEARKKNIARLYSEASEAARRLFLRKNFSVIRCRDFEIDGVAIHNYAMEKRLDA